MKLFKTMSGQFSGADPDTIKRLDKIRVGETIEVDPIKREVRRNRSTKQNAYYWGVVIKILEAYLQEQGLDSEMIHTALKIGCFGAKEVFGVMVPAKSTQELSTDEMEQYLTWIRQWASSFRNIYIPLPNECGYSY